MSPSLESFAPGGISNRRLHLLELDRAEDLEDVAFGFEQHSTALLAWNAEGVETALVCQVLEGLLDRKAVSISCWGEDCERVHDVLDETIAVPGSEVSRYSSATMTTWHARESFDEVLWYALFVAQPTDLYERSCSDSIVVVIGEAALAERARGALRDPDAFSESLLAQNPSG